jgi:ubiquitin carboxyl-terminal hydrolase 14
MDSAPTIKVSVKWQKQVFEDVELNMNEDIEMFKGQIYALSNVPVDK